MSRKEEMEEKAQKEVEQVISNYRLVLFASFFFSASMILPIDVLSLCKYHRVSYQPWNLPL